MRLDDYYTVNYYYDCNGAELVRIAELLYPFCKYCGKEFPYGGGTGHIERVVGKWSRPSTVMEKLRGAKAVFIPKEKE